MRQSDYPKALTLAQAVVARRPNDYYGHWYLGKIYLAMDDVPHAESEYARAYDLNPIDNLRKELDAIRAVVSTKGLRPSRHRSHRPDHP